MRTVSENDRKIGSLIREARKGRGVSVKEVASRICVSATQMHKYEIGKNRISAANLAIVADFLGKDISEFYGARPPLSVRASILASAFDRLADSKFKIAVFELVLAAADRTEAEAS